MFLVEYFCHDLISGQDKRTTGLVVIHYIRLLLYEQTFMPYPFHNPRMIWLKRLGSVSGFLKMCDPLTACESKSTSEVTVVIVKRPNLCNCCFL